MLSRGTWTRVVVGGMETTVHTPQLRRSKMDAELCLGGDEQITPHFLACLWDR